MNNLYVDNFVTDNIENDEQVMYEIIDDYSQQKSDDAESENRADEPDTAERGNHHLKLPQMIVSDDDEEEYETIEIVNDDDDDNPDHTEKLEEENIFVNESANLIETDFDVVYMLHESDINTYNPLPKNSNNDKQKRKTQKMSSAKSSTPKPAISQVRSKFTYNPNAQSDPNVNVVHIDKAKELANILKITSIRCKSRFAGPYVRQKKN